VHAAERVAVSARRVEIGFEHFLATLRGQCQPVDGRGLGERAAKTFDPLECATGIDGERRQPGRVRQQRKRRPLGQAVPRVAGGEKAADQNFQTRFSCSVSNEGEPVAFSKSIQRMR
jgi:hypothetical protein